MPELPVPLQTDTVSTLPGGGIRTITARVVVNGQLQDVQMQVVAIADANGVLFDANEDRQIQIAILQEIRDLKRIMAYSAELPFLDPAISTFDSDA
jgi:hypothetical protein